MLILGFTKQMQSLLFKSNFISSFGIGRNTRIIVVSTLIFKILSDPPAIEGASFLNMDDINDILFFGTSDCYRLLFYSVGVNANSKFYTML
jgi:hypothetical protein